MANNKKPEGWETKLTDEEAVIYSTASRKRDEAIRELEKKHGVKKREMGVDLYSQMIQKVPEEYGDEYEKIYESWTAELERGIPRCDWR